MLDDTKPFRGQFQTLSDNALVLRLASGEKTFDRQHVLRVSTARKSRRGRNALIGLAVGLGAGVIVAVASPELGQGKCAQGSCVNAESVPVAGVAGAAVGAAIGAAITSHATTTVYLAERKTAE